MYDFDKHLSALGKQTILCVGDLMLDEFVYGDVSRISPEAPTPVIAVKRTELMIGGAGNVARNLVALGARCIFVGAVGDDEAGGDGHFQNEREPEQQIGGHWKSATRHCRA